MYEAAVMLFFVLWDAVTLQASCLMLCRDISRRSSGEAFLLPSQGLHSNYICAPRAGAAVPCVESSQRIPRLSRHVNTSQRSVGDKLDFEERFPKSSWLLLSSLATFLRKRATMSQISHICLCLVHGISPLKGTLTDDVVESAEGCERIKPGLRATFDKGNMKLDTDPRNIILERLPGVWDA